jgi:hypothetical protein
MMDRTRCACGRSDQLITSAVTAAQAAAAPAGKAWSALEGDARNGSAAPPEWADLKFDRPVKIRVAGFESIPSVKCAAYER